MPDNRRSKRLAYWLRHAPEAAELKVDSAGWAPAEAILQALQESGLPTSKVHLQALIANNEKQRFEMSEDGSRVRARQGHSIKIEGDWLITAPPEFLFHGTAKIFVEPILRQGLRRGSRHHVHLSASIESARTVGARKGPPVVLSIAAGEMAKDGFLFRLSSNGVWLADRVPPIYVEELPHP
jgi:putative RNA 2'-phosphotransferase